MGCALIPPGAHPGFFNGGWWEAQMMMKRIVMFGIAAVLGLGLVVVPTFISPQQAARALACYSSVTCQPLNVTMLAESGITLVPKVAGVAAADATRAVVAKGSVGLLWGKLRPILGGFLAVTSLIDMFGGGDQKVSGGLSTDGLYGQRIATDGSVGTNPEWEVGGTGSSFTEAGGATVTARISRLVNASLPTYSCFDLAGDVGDLIDDLYVYSKKNGVWGGASPYFTSSRSGCGSVAVGEQQTYANIQGASEWAIGRGGSRGSSVFPTSSMANGTATASVKCQGAGGSIRVVTVSLVQSFVAGETMTVPDVGCADDELAVGADVDWMPDGGIAQRVIDSSDGTQLLPEQKEMRTDYPDCFTALAGACVMILKELAADGSEKSCGNIGELCEDWATDPNRDTRYVCRYGATLITLDHCSAYRRPALGVLPNIGADGLLLAPDAPVPEVQQPATEINTAPAPAVPESDDAACRPASWLEGLNPYWMFRAVQCALRDAFVPPEALVKAAMTRAQTAWETTTPVKVSQSINVLVAALPTGSGCSGIALHWPSVLGVPAVEAEFLNACEEPLATVASITSTVGALGMVWFGVLAIVRLAGGVIAFPGLGKGGE